MEGTVGFQTLWLLLGWIKQQAEPTTQSSQEKPSMDESFNLCEHHLGSSNVNGSRYYYWETGTQLGPLLEPPASPPHSYA